MEESKPKKPQITIGYKIGRLTVKEATKERRSRYTIWRCQCECGNEIKLDTRCLQRGTVTDCGCVTKVRPGQTDLTGVRFGRLVCLNPTDERSKCGGTIWRCKCDCGEECLVSIGQLNSGARKNCGCLEQPPLEEYIGKQFGKLTIIAYAGKRAGNFRWKCRCECGNEVIVGESRLQSGRTTNCGCIEDARAAKDSDAPAFRKRKFINNKSGYTGIYRNTVNSKWIAQITIQRKTYYLGSFNTIEDAIAARKRAEEKHENFMEWYHSEYRK